MSDPIEIMRHAKVIAVVGFSRFRHKAAHNVPLELRDAGYRVIGVNPAAVGEVEGVPVVAALSDIKEPIDIVDVFRPAAYTPAVAREAVAAGAKAVWLQLGIVSGEARRICEEAGLDYVENHCTAVELRLLKHQDG